MNTPDLNYTHTKILRVLAHPILMNNSDELLEDALVDNDISSLLKGSGKLKLLNKMLPKLLQDHDRKVCNVIGPSIYIVNNPL